MFLWCTLLSVRANTAYKCGAQRKHNEAKQNVGFRWTLPRPERVTDNVLGCTYIMEKRTIVSPCVRRADGMFENYITTKHDRNNANKRSCPVQTGRRDKSL